MMKRIYGGLFILSAAALAWIYMLWGWVDGQVLARFFGRPDAQLKENIEAVLDDGLQYGLFSMKNASLGAAGDVLAYECAAYRPDALGIRLVSGAPVTEKQLAQGERIVMLSAAAALELHPGLDCIGRTVQIDGTDYKIIGIYESCSPLGFLTDASEKSVILPMAQEASQKSLILWVRTQGNSRALQQHLENRIAGLHASDEFMSLHLINPGFAAQAGRQRILLFIWFELVIISRMLSGRMKDRRAAFVRRLRADHDRYYLGKTLLRSVPNACRNLLPPLCPVLVCLLSGAWLAAKLVLDESIFPARFLNLNEWFKLFRSNALTANAAPGLPVFAALLCGRLRALSSLACGCGFAALLLYASERKKQI